MSTQYPSKNSSHQQKDKKGNRNEKKEDDSRSRDKDNNTTGTAGAHVGDVTTPKNSTAPSREVSIDIHVLEATEQPSRLTRSVEDLLVRSIFHG